MTEYLQQALEGELLGDGCLCVEGTKARFSLTTSKEGQADLAFLALSELGPSKRPFVRSSTSKCARQTSGWRVRTRSSTELGVLRGLWYPNGKKVVPRSFRLTSVSALHWYVGDGHLDVSRPWAWFCTDGFDETSVHHLGSELTRYGFTPKLIHKKGEGRRYWRIALGVDDVQKFLAWVGPCPVPELTHKWSAVFKTKRYPRIRAEQRESIEILRKTGKSYPEIAAIVGCSVNGAWKVLNG